MTMREFEINSYAVAEPEESEIEAPSFCNKVG